MSFHRTSLWRKRILLASTILAGLTSSLSVASGNLPGEYYPKNVSPRLFGTDQWVTGSCFAHSKVNAIEQVYSNMGRSVMLSAAHAHHYHWYEDANPAGALLNPTTEAERAFLERTGLLLPDYMLPEDEGGLRPLRSAKVPADPQDFPGLKPYASGKAVVDPEFRPVDQFNFRDMFVGYGSADGSLDAIKSKVARGLPVEIGLHGELLSMFAERTGLLSNGYSRSALEARLTARGQTWENGFNHAVAVVGYDDNLYVDDPNVGGTKGAFIIRNSWNDSLRVGSTLAELDEAERIAYARFRGRFLPANFPGYYALPYAYVQDAIDSRQYGYWYQTFDFAAFADQYSRLRERYTVLALPYACSTQAHIPQAAVKQYGLSASFSDKFAVVMRELGTRRQAKFGLAKLVRYAHGGNVVDQAQTFYSGTNPDWNSYYCGGFVKNGVAPTIWPGADLRGAPGVSEGIHAIAETPQSPQSWMSFFDALNAALP